MVYTLTDQVLKVIIKTGAWHVLQHLMGVIAPVAPIQLKALQ